MKSPIVPLPTIDEEKVGEETIATRDKSEEVVKIDIETPKEEGGCSSLRRMLLLPKTRSVLVMALLVSALCALVVHTHPAPAPAPSTLTTQNQFQIYTQPSGLHPDPESLPPDTFRKLAQALYQRGDKAENRLERKFFYDTNVTCNDGSVAGYYIRRNYESKRWIIFLEGGWICHDSISCAERAAREKHRMSSDRWTKVRTVGGILSADPEENPHFADANHVFVPYCSSDSWSGTAKTKNADGLTFMGSHIVREVIRELADFQQLLFGEELFLTGSSAGGTGVLVNVDYVAQMVSNAGLRVRGLVDSGWFLDNDPFKTECQNGKGQCSVIKHLQNGVQLWGSRVHQDCEANYPGEVWQCFLGYKVFPFIKTPLFIFQWQFDSFQLYADNVANPASSEQWDYIHTMGSNLRSTFENLNGLSAVFSPSCIAHEVITKMEWTEVTVEGVSLPDALACWSQSLPDAIEPPPAQIRAGHPASHSRAGGESSDNEVLYDTDNRGQLQMFNDAPGHRRFERERIYKLPSNLVRSLKTDSEEDSINSLSTRLNQRKTRKHVTDNRTTTSGSSKSRRRRRRRHRQIVKCRAGDEAACKKISEAEKTDAKISARPNSELVRSLDRRSSRVTGRGSGRKNKKNNRKNHRLSKAERRQRRRERRQQKRRERRMRRLQKRRQKKLKAKKAKKDQKRSKRSPPRQCHKPKHVDTCSWPHCNRSCPKLKNPETGQEVDFLTLLKSFGLDMENVARALGVDINTLNNMDKDVLLHKLTSQTGSD